MELRAISLADGTALHSQNLGLRGNPTPWDHLAEAWRSAIWALCHPHWLPTTTQKLRGLYADIAGPVLLEMGREHGDAVLNHLAQVGDLVNLPGGYWLPAPARSLDWGASSRPQLIGGVPSWVLEKMQPRWAGDAGFRRTAEDLDLPSVAAEEWCDRAHPKGSLRTIQEGTRLIDRQPSRIFERTEQIELTNRALRSEINPPIGTWMVAKASATHQLIGVAERTASGWLLRSVPLEIDPPAAALICQIRAGGSEQWTQSDTPDGLRLHFFRKLPRWHRCTLLCHALRPEMSGEEVRGYDYVVAPESLGWIESNVLSPLQLRLT